MNSPINSVDIIDPTIRPNNMVINGMYINQNNTLLSIATDKGYKIYETYNFLQLSEDDDYQELIGSLKIALTFYESHLVFLVGKEDNTTFLSSHLVVWDDIKKMKIGVIMLKENILDAYVNKEAIYLLIKNKILVFGLRKLNYLCTIQDVNHMKTNSLCISRNSNPVVVATVPSTRTNQLKVSKFSLNKNCEIEAKAHYVVSTPFQSIYRMNISKKGDYAIIVGHPENKIHVYSLEDFQLKICMESESQNENILSIQFSKKQKFFSILNQDFNLEIFALPIEKKNKTISCICESKLMAPLDYEDGVDPSTKLKEGKGFKKFFSGAFTKFRQIFNKKKKSFSKYIYDPFNLNMIGTKIQYERNIQEAGILRMKGQERTKLIIQFDKVNEIVRFILKFILL